MLAPKPLAPLQFKPKPGRLPERKRMTIVLGIIATDGIVLAADREEQHPGFMKVSQSKMRVHQVAGKRSGTCLIAGAGNSATHIDAQMEAVLEAFTAHPDAIGAELQECLSAAVGKFHRDHIIPLSQDRSQRPMIEMLIACEREPTSLLLETCETVTVTRRPYAAVGIGAFAARALLGRLHRRMDTFSTALLAAYVTYQVKETIEGCGKQTDISYIRGNECHSMIPRNLAELELAFDDYALTEKRVAEYLFSKEKPDEKRLMDMLAEDRSAFQGLGLRSHGSMIPRVGQLGRRQHLSGGFLDDLVGQLVCVSGPLTCSGRHGLKVMPAFRSFKAGRSQTRPLPNNV